MNKTDLCGLTAEEICSLGQLEMHQAVTVANYIYKKRIDNISEIPKISKKVKEKLDEISIPGILKPTVSEISSDRTVKYLFRNSEGLEYETVYIPDGKRNTVCVSTQSGCRMGCSFCATAKYGYHGNLSTGEIVSQVTGIPEAGKITHVVFMGMGEPMDNLSNVLRACEIFTAEWGLAISSRNVTVSTVGITPEILRFLVCSDCNLTLSLHSPFSEERMKVVPVEKKYPFHDIMEILRPVSLSKKRRISAAYIMINGCNDTERHLEKLKEIFKNSRIRINLLPYHSIPGNENISASPDRMQYFKHELVMAGVSASIRKSRGIDISAACGLLASGLK